MSIFLSYAVSDGQAAATQLRQRLQLAGLTVRQDVAGLQGGPDWKEQLRQALQDVNVVLVLLTPGSVASPYVTLEWELALLLKKTVIPVVVADCEIPPDLKRLPSRDLSLPGKYGEELLKLIGDIQRTDEEAKASPAVAQPAEPQSGPVFNQSGWTVNGAAQFITAPGARVAGGNYYENLTQYISQGEKALDDKLVEIKAKIASYPPEKQVEIEEAVGNTVEAAKEIQRGDITPQTESRLRHWLKVLAATAPELAAVATATFLSPPAGVTMALALIAKKAQQEIDAEKKQAENPTGGAH